MHNSGKYSWLCLGMGMAFLAALVQPHPSLAQVTKPGDPIRVVGALTLTGDPIPGERIGLGEDDAGRALNGLRGRHRPVEHGLREARDPHGGRGGPAPAR